MSHGVPHIRPYTPADLQQVRYVIRSAVRIGCRVDHCNDQGTIDAWLAAAEHDLHDADYCIVKDRFQGYLDGVAALVFHYDGLQIVAAQLTLNYVVPEAFRMGVASDMLKHMEDYAKERGFYRMLLWSTAAARPFYFKQGYQEHLEPKRGNGVSWNFPMYKSL